MQLELDDKEMQILRDALVHYLSNLREEVVKTEKHEWRVKLHDEEDTLTRIIAKLR